MGLSLIINNTIHTICAIFIYIAVPLVLQDALSPIIPYLLSGLLTGNNALYVYTLSQSAFIFILPVAFNSISAVIVLLLAYTKVNNIRWPILSRQIKKGM